MDVVDADIQSPCSHPQTLCGLESGELSTSSDQFLSPPGLNNCLWEHCEQENMECDISGHHSGVLRTVVQEPSANDISKKSVKFCAAQFNSLVATILFVFTGTKKYQRYWFIDVKHNAFSGM